jgi:hypothetical protein
MSEVKELNAITQASFDLEPSIPKRQGYWATHEYHRLNVEDYVEEFCGWRALRQLADLFYNDMAKMFFVTSFLTGGRASEVLLLKKNNFQVIPSMKLIKVEGMRLLKQYFYTSETYLDSQGKKHRKTQLKYTLRKTFTIQRREPFVILLEKYLSKLNDPDPDGKSVYLFPSPYAHHRNFKKGHLLNKREERFTPDALGNIPFTPQWAYLNIRRVNNLAFKDLKGRLGLLRPFFGHLEGKTEPVKLSDEIHLWIHWIRSQRASQLVADYGLSAEELVEHFQWQDLETAMRYAKTGWKRIADKMTKARVSYD